MNYIYIFVLTPLTTTMMNIKYYFVFQKGNLCAHPIVELIRDGQIDYVVPLAWQFDYYVPQAKKYYRMMDMHEVSSQSSQP
jgi:hypothetical protein